jgi:ferritin-like metal-binding protein YciE
MSLNSLADAFYDELRDIYSAEKQLVEALPKMVENASSEDLRRALDEHLDETKRQVQRLETAFEDTGKAARAKTCEAMKGLIEEADGVLAEEAEPAVKDAVMIGSAQKVEHYEIATYGTLCAWAQALGYSKALAALEENMAEEEAADKKLSDLAETINQAALEGTAT